MTLYRGIVVQILGCHRAIEKCVGNGGSSCGAGEEGARRVSRQEAKVQGVPKGDEERHVHRSNPDVTHGGSPRQWIL